MPITFIRKRKKQEYLIVIFVIILLAVGFILWRGFLRTERVEKFIFPGITPPPTRTIKINIGVLENLSLQELQPFEGILSPAPGTEGRDNPFLPYEVAAERTEE